MNRIFSERYFQNGGEKVSRLILQEGYFDMGKVIDDPFIWQKKIGEIICCNNLSCKNCWDAADDVIEIISMFLEKRVKFEEGELREMIAEALICNDVNCLDCAQASIEIAALIKDL